MKPPQVIARAAACWVRLAGRLGPGLRPSSAAPLSAAHCWLSTWLTVRGLPLPSWLAVLVDPRRRWSRRRLADTLVADGLVVGAVVGVGRHFLVLLGSPASSLLALPPVLARQIAIRGPGNSRPHAWEGMAPSDRGRRVLL